MAIIQNICEVFDEAKSINVYRDGQILRFSGGETFEIILDGFDEMIEGSHPMPAFGVSLDDCAREDLKKGLWVEFEFNERLFFDQMPFEKLLVCVQEGWRGFNIVRYNSECGYHGRCFYLDLRGDMSKFYKILKNL